MYASPSHFVHVGVGSGGYQSDHRQPLGSDCASLAGLGVRQEPWIEHLRWSKHVCLPEVLVNVMDGGIPNPTMVMEDGGIPNPTMDSHATAVMHPHGTSSLRKITAILQENIPAQQIKVIIQARIGTLVATRRFTKPPLVGMV